MPLLAAMASLPLVFSSGAGSVGSRSLGVTLLGGYVVYASIAAVRLWAVRFKENEVEK
jgi:multidrug efflux pump subunit AcrB